MKAKLKHWTHDGTAGRLGRSGSAPGADADRLRDIEIGDVSGDGKDDIVLATHDQGVVAVGTETDGTWTFVEMDQKADTFVREIEIGDVDGDGQKEFYATPSDRNKASGESQPGSVYRYDVKGDTYELTVVSFVSRTPRRSSSPTSMQMASTSCTSCVRPTPRRTTTARSGTRPGPHRPGDAQGWRLGQRDRRHH